MVPHHDSERPITPALSLSEASLPYRGIECLPPEIISHILTIGSRKLGPEDLGISEDEQYNADIDENADDDGNDNLSQGPPVHFATLCSHVCQYWRTVAISTCQLWSYLDFGEDLALVPLLERSELWIARSGDVPLIIDIDLTDIELAYGELKSHAILELILPHAHRWRVFELATDFYGLIWLWQRRLASLRSAPTLEQLGMSCHEEQIDPDVFEPRAYRSPQVLFPQGTPKLRSILLWGVHFDWEVITFLTGLEMLELAWHTKDVRLTTEQFVQTLSSSPKLRTLALTGSAPLPGTWPQERLSLPNLVRLDIKEIDINDAVSVVDHIEFPALTTLNLDLESNDVKMFIRAVCQPNKPRFGSLRSLELVSFDCSQADGRLFLGTLLNVKHISLNFDYLPIHFHHSLTADSPFLCPRLETLRLSGLTSKHLKALVEARLRSPTPIQRLAIDEDNKYSAATIQWLRSRVKTVQFFENSDVESDEEDEGSENDDAYEESDED
ncbi:hypothetical protein JB92DRAFT_2873472 [Gautieria morchelliformis]|nr:hypothetical protein JB92DRAFT_2873472 [Gautieria morchelliformis]